MGVLELFENILNGLLGLPPTAVYAVIGILAGVENIFPPVPADTAVAIGAFLSTGGAISAGTGGKMFSIKAKTNEKMDAVGRGKGLMVYAIVSLGGA